MSLLWVLSALAETFDVATCPALLSDPAQPATVQAAAAAAGWADVEVRKRYICEVARIAPADAVLAAQGVSLADRAHAAWQMRHDARLLARAMMKDEAEVEALRARDQEKYGNPEGPTFEYLVEKGKKDGKADDAVYEGIIASASKTNPDINAALGL